MGKDLHSLFVAYKVECREESFEQSSDDDDTDEDCAGRKSSGWKNQDVNKKFLIFKKTRLTKVDMLKCVPIFTQSKHDVVLAVKSKFDEILCVCKMKYDTRNQLRKTKKSI